MTKVEAIIEASKLQPVIDALVEFGFEDLTVENVRTTAEHSHDASVLYRGARGASFFFETEDRKGGPR
jgi:nitrogen regulatory protein PII